VPELPFAELLNALCYIHAYIDPKKNTKKSSHLLRDCRQFLEFQKFYESSKGQAYHMVPGAQLPNPPPPTQHPVQQVQPRAPNEAFPPPRG
jgi:hypothetical protein